MSDTGATTTRKPQQEGGSNNPNPNSNNRSRNRNRNKNNNKSSSSSATKPYPEKEKKVPQLQPEVHHNINLVDEDDEAPEHQYCLICYTSNLHQERGITPCGHDSVCASCHLRLRSLLTDNKCPICKASNEQIIIDNDPDPDIDQHKSFDQYEKWGEDIGPKYTYRPDVGMFFPVSYYHSNVTPLFALSCNAGKCQFTNDSSESNSPGTYKALASHLSTAHNPPLQICDLCITHKRDFISRLPRFTSHQLNIHNKHGDEGSGAHKNASGSGKANKGHPLCQFCQPLRFYDLYELHKHLNKDHYECHVCKKIEKPLQFFKDYNKLNLHFDREHYLCRFPECLAARFVVFPNEIDLKAHERDMHGLVSGGSTKIQMEFRVRGSGRDGSGHGQQGGGQMQQVPNMEEDFGFGLDGGVFVPESLDDTNNNNASQQQQQQQMNEQGISHGPHAERTALFREQARMRREELGITGENSEGLASLEAFPTLGNQGGGGNLISWSGRGGPSAVSTLRGRNTTALNDMNFPTLGGPSETRIATNATSKLRSTKGANSQFSAITRTANAAASTSTSRPFANAAATSGYGSVGRSASAATPNFSADNFPSLGGGMSSTSNAFGRSAKPDFSADNFPSLGGSTSSSASGFGMGMGMGGGNKYAAAQAYAKKNAAKSAGVNFDLDQHFPAPSMSGSSKTAAKKNSVFDMKPAAQIATDNFLAFPPPSASIKIDGKDQVEGMKQCLGQAKYKELKRKTKEFALGSLEPESYITAIISLFDGGIKDPSLWEYIPNLISSIPNESSTKRAMRYLESLRYSSGQTASSTSSVSSSSARQTASTGWLSTAAAASSALASTRPVAAPLQYGKAAAYAPSISAKQNVSAGFTGRSIPLTQIKKKASWNGSNASVAAVASIRAGSAIAAAAALAPEIGTATKFMAKAKADERKAKHAESIAKQGAGTGKKKKSAKKNELRDLAFGKA